MIRIVRQGDVPMTRERWFLWGVVKVITHPQPYRLQDRRDRQPPAGAPSRATPAGAIGPVVTT